MMGKKARWTAITVLIVLLPVTAAAQTPLTLQQVYHSALKANEQIHIAREALRTARDEKRKAIAGLLPNLTSSASYSRRPHDVLAPNGVITRPMQENEIEISLQQPIYSGGRAMATYRMAKGAVRESTEALQEVRENLLFEAATAYFDVLKAEQNRTIDKFEVDRLIRHEKAAQTRLEVGEVTKTIVLRAQAELSGARANLARVEAELKNARDRLMLLAKLPADFELAEPEEPFLPGEDEEQLYALAVRKRSDFAAAQIRQAIAQDGVRFARGSFLPTLSLEGEYTRQDQDSKNPFFFVKVDKRATISLTFPIFEGGLRLAELSQARSKARQADLERALLEDQIRVEVRTALRDLEAIRSVLANLKDQVAFAQENFTLVEKQFAFGLATNIDVLDANSLLHDAERQLSNARFDRNLAILRVQRTVGIFPEGTELDSVPGDGPLQEGDLRTLSE